MERLWKSLFLTLFESCPNPIKSRSLSLSVSRSLCLGLSSIDFWTELLWKPSNHRGNIRYIFFAEGIDAGFESELVPNGEKLKDGMGRIEGGNRMEQNMKCLNIPCTMHMFSAIS